MSKTLHKQASKYHDVYLLQRWFQGLKGEAWDVAALAVLTGLRREELYRVQPSWVHKNKGVYILLSVPTSAAKAGKAREIGLVPMAWGIIEKACPFKEDHRRVYVYTALYVKNKRREAQGKERPCNQSSVDYSSCSKGCMRHAYLRRW